MADGLPVAAAKTSSSHRGENPTEDVADASAEEAAAAADSVSAVTKMRVSSKRKRQVIQTWTDINDDSMPRTVARMFQMMQNGDAPTLGAITNSLMFQVKYIITDTVDSHTD